MHVTLQRKSEDNVIGHSAANKSKTDVVSMWSNPTFDWTKNLKHCSKTAQDSNVGLTHYPPKSAVAL